jgi:hypothetical protein
VAEQLQPKPQLVIPDELAAPAQDALTTLDSAIYSDPSRAVAVLTKMAAGQDVGRSNMDDVRLVSAVNAAIEASEYGRHLQFDEPTEDRVFTPQIQALGAKMHFSNGEKNRQARRDVTLHRLLGYAGCVTLFNQQETQQNPPSVA